MEKVDFCVLQKHLGSASSVNSTAALNYHQILGNVSEYRRNVPRMLGNRRLLGMPCGMGAVLVS